MNKPVIGDWIMATDHGFKLVEIMVKTDQHGKKQKVFGILDPENSLVIKAAEATSLEEYIETLPEEWELKKDRIKRQKLQEKKVVYVIAHGGCPDFTAEEWDEVYKEEEDMSDEDFVPIAKADIKTEERICPCCYEQVALNECVHVTFTQCKGYGCNADVVNNENDGHCIRHAKAI